MPLREPTQQEVLDQLNSGLNWGSSVITYSFPVTSKGFYIDGEGPGFTAMLASGQEAARLALSLWDDLIVANFQEISSGASYVSSDLEFGMTTTGIDYAQAYFPTVGSIWFNPIYGSSSGSNNIISPTIGLHGFKTFIHEIGHALGLEHSGDYNGAGDWSPLNMHDSTVFTVMSYFGPDWEFGQGQVAWADWIGSNGVLYSPQTPMLNDIFVIQTIYGVETTTRIENTTYGFNSNITEHIGQIYDFTRNSNPILTIYDSAGIDTLDLSGWSTSSIIDIGQGRFSSCNSMTNNITIAFGCDIENARGGAGNDKIYGNALNNILFGGAGNDELFGLGGDDTIYGGLGSDTVVFTLARSAYQITSFQNYLTVQGSSGTIVLYEIEDLRFSDVTVPASSISESFDTTAPIVSTFSPSDSATGVTLSANIVVTFSEAIARGTGTITLRSGSATGTIVESFNAATSNRLTVTDTTLTIDPTRNLSANTQYFVVFTSGNIKDIAGNAYAGISDYDFRTQAPDTTVPTFTSATTSVDGLKVILTYNEPLHATTAAKTAFAVKVAGVTTTVNSVAVNGSTVELTLATSIGAGQAVTVGYTAPTRSAATTNAAVQDIAGNDAATLAATTAATNISTVDKTAPIVSTFTPSDGLTGVAVGANIALTFSEAISRGTGTITLRSGSATGTIVESFDAASSGRLTLSGSTLSIDPTSNLSANTQYFVVFTSSNIKDTAGNAYAGTRTYDFRTVNIINGTATNNTLTGTVNADTINGLAGNDIITGGAGTDSMDGGEGSDLYIVAASADHSAAEFADTGTSGTDEVRFTSTTANATLTLYAGDTGIEKVAIGTGTAAAAVTTATTALNINASALTSGITLTGNAGANVLTGGSGNDTLLGGSGNDTLNGGIGFDYADYSTATSAITISLALSSAQITGGAGTDTLSNIEGLIGGSAADRLTGNAADNILIGLGGNDTISGGDGFDQLRGGAGNDTLTGGTGIDWFIFDTTPNATSNRDTIIDFTSGTDKLQFSKAIFTGLSGAALGDLSSNAFWSGAGVTTAHDADDRFIYNTTNGSLYYDADGNASGSAAVLVATLGATTPLAFTDLVIFG